MDHIPDWAPTIFLLSSYNIFIISIFFPQGKNRSPLPTSSWLPSPVDFLPLTIYQILPKFPPLSHLPSSLTCSTEIAPDWSSSSQHAPPQGSCWQQPIDLSKPRHDHASLLLKPSSGSLSFPRVRAKSITWSLRICKPDLLPTYTALSSPLALSLLPSISGFHFFPWISCHI